MTNEEAKELYGRATGALKAGDPAGALRMLDELDAARPNSRQVTLQRGLCFVRLDRLEEAEGCLAKLKGKLEPEKLGDLEAAIGAKRAISASGDNAPPTPSTAGGAGASKNVLVVESTFPVSTTEATVTGHVESGVFHTGDTLTVTTDSGMPILAPIKRIGTADSPLKLVREGQKAVLLLEVEPHHIRTGGKLVSQAQEDAYAKTMVVGSSSGDTAAAPEELSSDVLKIERDIKSGKHAEAHAALEAYLAENPESRAAHRVMARLYLDSPDHRDTGKALEYVQRAYELGGANDSAVVDTLARAMGENGEGEHGVRFMERQAEHLTDPTARAALVSRVNEYRNEYDLGHVWEFSDTYGDVVFETKNLSEAARALKTNKIPRDGKVRRDKVGDWRDIETALAGQNSEIAAIYQAPAKVNNLPLVIGGVVVLLIVVAIAGYLATQ